MHDNIGMEYYGIIPNYLLITLRGIFNILYLRNICLISKWNYHYAILTLFL